MFEYLIKTLSSAKGISTRLKIIAVFHFSIFILLSNTEICAKHLQEISYSPDGSQFLVRYREGVELWNSDTGTVIANFPSFEKDSSSNIAYKFAAFVDDGNLILLNDEKNNLIWWSVKNNERLEVHSEKFSVDAVSVNGKLNASQQFDDNKRPVINIYDSINGNFLKSLTPPLSSVSCLSFFPDNQRILVGSSPQANVISLNSGRVTKRFISANYIRNCRVSPTGTSVLMSSFFGGPSGKRSFPILTLDAKKRYFSVKGKYANLMKYSNSVGYSVAEPNLAFVTGSSAISGEGVLIIWDISNGKVKQVIKNETEIENAAFSPNGKTILFVDRRRNLVLVDLASGVRIRNYNAPSLKENLSIKY